MHEDYTIIKYLNDNFIEFERIKNNDDRFLILSHKRFYSKDKIILFDIKGEYKMFIYRDNEMFNPINYTNMLETWSVFNTLSLKAFHTETKVKLIK